MKITFLGAGAFGVALSKIAKYNGHEVNFFDPIKFPDISLYDAISGADVVVYAAPAEKATEVLPELDKNTPLICASKGFLSLKPFQDFKDFSLLYGATFAHDIDIALGEAEPKKDSPEFYTLTATSPLSEQIFSTENIKIEYTTDQKGVLLCGALKNVYAIGAGLFGEDDQTTADEAPVIKPYLAEVIPEFMDILKANQVDFRILLLSCGTADLIITCTPESRNFRLGRALKTGQKTDGLGTTEGLFVISQIENNPDFVLPASATVLKNIIKIVKEKRNAKS